jgi:lipopolysaccharide/colanic/teichoic acid biosynthesis glycosyltransferase
MYRRRVKRWLDIAVSGSALLLLSPLILAVALAVRIALGSPVVFRQRRPGWNTRIFECLKFRTMTNARDAQGNLLADAQRLTRFGLLLRRTSLDELPQLWNVLRGDMSLIGPRPLLEEYLPYYTHEELRRHEVRPGITGWAQIHGRNCLAPGPRLAMDVWYVDHLDWRLDLRILVATFFRVVRQDGFQVDPTAAGSFTASRPRRAES